MANKSHLMSFSHEGKQRLVIPAVWLGCATFHLVKFVCKYENFEQKSLWNDNDNIGQNKAFTIQGGNISNDGIGNTILTPASVVQPRYLTVLQLLTLYMLGGGFCNELQNEKEIFKWCNDGTGGTI